MKIQYITTLILFLTLLACQDSNKKSEEKPPAPKPQIAMNIVGVPWPADSGRIRIHVVHDSTSEHRQIMDGTVSRGTYTIDSTGFSRQYIYVAYHPDSLHGCNDYSFYSWVNPSLEIDAGSGAFQPIPDKIANDLMNSYAKGKAATGRPFKFGIWNPDSQKQWADSVNNARKLRKESPFPLLHPRDSLQNGQPYMPMPTPEGDGFLDSPSMTPRGKNNEASPGEYIFAALLNARPIKAAQAPPPITGRLKFTVRGETYLYCLKQQQCLGFFTWTSTEIMTITITYEDKGGTPVMGMNMKNWTPVPRFTFVSTLTMGPWQSCYSL